MICPGPGLYAQQLKVWGCMWLTFKALYQQSAICLHRRICIFDNHLWSNHLLHSGAPSPDIYGCTEYNIQLQYS